MGTINVPLDEAELLSVLLEALLYGFSLLMCGGTIWVLLSQRSTRRVNFKMLTVACMLLLFSTVHLGIDIIRTMEGLILYRDTYPGGPVGYFSDVSQWTLLSKTYVYIVQTLIGDSVVLYRCYAVWQSKLVMILPVLLWCAVAVTGSLSCYTALKVTEDGVSREALFQWITSFWATALATNLLTTLLLVSRIWDVNRRATGSSYSPQSQLRSILHTLVDADAIYSITLLAALTCFVSQTNGQYVVPDMVTPIISITFYMVIIRVGVAPRAKKRTTIASFGNINDTLREEPEWRTEVRVTTLTHSIVDDGQHSLATLTHSINDKNHPTEMRTTA
ncbi:hypothetical protein L210DRAFT_3548252 [Boletus edulis BED1]|uniref:Uncharacterized protein n=1 Tax=Boletus edulis BED1 TaxID=1328754 RepID=A0AAD4GD87_BOLED|nr:hypothetical protein L210DRAFT_3548252 [Boletus edulis BED1]